MPQPAELLQSYAAARGRAAFFDLSDYGKLELTGRDAALFLHNLSTNDIKSLPINASCEAFLCTMKARTIAYFMVNHRKEGLLLDMAPGLAEKVFRHLDKHLISEQVEIADRSKQIGLLRVVGPDSRSLVEKALGTPIEDITALHLLETPRCLVRRQQWGSLPVLDLFFAVDDLVQMMDDVNNAGIEYGSPQVHEILRIEAGIPEYFKDMDDERFVMEVGRTAQAISFTKGCYLGQEPIVMARDRGHVNRTLMGIKTESFEVAAGTKLFQGESEVGVVTSAAWSPGLKQMIGLAYLRRGSQEAGMELRIEPGRKAVVAALPFAV